MRLTTGILLASAVAAGTLMLGSCPAPASSADGNGTPELVVRGPLGTTIANGATYTIPATRLGDWWEVALTVANVGTETLHLTGAPAVLVEGPDADLFSLQTQPLLSLAPGAFTTFALRFAPDAVAVSEATIKITSDTGADPYAFTVNASGVDENLQTTSDSDPSVVWTGAGYGMAWQKLLGGDNWEIYFARFDATGAKIGSDVRVTSAANSSLCPSLVWTGTEYGLAWHDGRDGNWEVYFARLDDQGVKIGGDVRVTNATNSSQNPSLVWTGSEYGLAWHDGRDANWEVYFTRLDDQGVKIGGDVRLTNATNSSQNPSLAWAGTGYGVAWHDGRDANWEIYFARVDADGNKVGDDVRITDALQSSQSPSLAWNGSEYLVAWSDGRDANWEIYDARISAAGAKVGSDVRITSKANSSQGPSLSWNGSGYGIAWYDGRDGNLEIYFNRLDGSGAKTGRDIRTTQASGVSQSPSLAWNGGGYAIGWYDDRAQPGVLEPRFVVRGE
jgi:hypothetical protein